eukprot:CAMPEP_0173142018 /NCGR_PEP_ID=MMETSP1105-20130129/5842_1 /TAXON_ID=2985 /ORGANISM="Ochromonas sp., Strain BG-1" /LENGTH=43 /DNA_ID= /DNA_START= /DNA_END= /DNA_ORIENTATION=
MPNRWMGKGRSLMGLELDVEEEEEGDDGREAGDDVAAICFNQS